MTKAIKTLVEISTGALPLSPEELVSAVINHKPKKEINAMPNKVAELKTILARKSTSENEIWPLL